MKSFKIAKLLTLVHIVLALVLNNSKELLGVHFFIDNFKYTFGLGLFNVLVITYIMYMYKKLIHSVYNSNLADKILNYFIVSAVVKTLLKYYAYYQLGVSQVEFLSYEESYFDSSDSVSLISTSSLIYLLGAVSFIQGVILIQVGNRVWKIDPESDRLKLIQAISFISYGFVSLVCMLGYLDGIYVFLSGLVLIGVLGYTFHQLEPELLSEQANTK